MAESPAEQRSKSEPVSEPVSEQRSATDRSPLPEHTFIRLDPSPSACAARQDCRSLSAGFEDIALPGVCAGMLDSSEALDLGVKSAQREIDVTLFDSEVPCRVTMNRFGCRVTCFQRLPGATPESLESATAEIAQAVANRYGPETHVDRQGRGVMRRTHRWALPGAKLEIVGLPGPSQVRFYYSR